MCNAFKPSSYQEWTFPEVETGEKNKIAIDLNLLIGVHQRDSNFTKHCSAKAVLGERQPAVRLFNLVFGFPTLFEMQTYCLLNSKYRKRFTD